MRFVECEKILIVMLHFLNVKDPTIAKIINSFRSGKSKSEVITTFANSSELEKLLNSYEYVFDQSRNKSTNKMSVFKVVKKWNDFNTIENKKRAYKKNFLKIE